MGLDYLNDYHDPVLKRACLGILPSQRGSYPLTGDVFVMHELCTLLCEPRQFEMSATTARVVWRAPQLGSSSHLGGCT